MTTINRIAEAILLINLVVLQWTFAIVDGAFRIAVPTLVVGWIIVSTAGMYEEMRFFIPSLPPFLLP